MVLVPPVVAVPGRSAHRPSMVIFLLCVSRNWPAKWPFVNTLMRPSPKLRTSARRSPTTACAQAHAPRRSSQACARLRVGDEDVAIVDHDVERCVPLRQAWIVEDRRWQVDQVEVTVKGVDPPVGEVSGQQERAERQIPFFVMAAIPDVRAINTRGSPLHAKM